MKRDAPRQTRLRLDTPVTYLKGVGPARAEALKRLGVVSAVDLLYHIPHRYEDASTISPIASLEPGMQGTVVGRVISKGVLPTRKGLRIFQAVLKDEMAKAFARLDQIGIEDNAKAVDALKKQGITIYQPSAEETANWQKVGTDSVQKLEGERSPSAEMTKAIADELATLRKK